MFSLVDWLFVAFGIALIVICAKRGLILTLIKFFKMLLSAIAAYFWGGSFAKFVGDKFLNAPIRASVYRKVEGVYRNAANGAGGEASFSVLPKYLQTEAMREKLGDFEETGDALVNAVTDTVSESVSSVICGVIGFALVFVVVFLALSVIYVLVKNAKRMFRTFGIADAVCGGVLGFVFVWTVLLFAGSILKFFCGNQPVYTDSTVVKFFGEATVSESLAFLNLDRWLNDLMNNSF